MATRTPQTAPTGDPAAWPLMADGEHQRRVGLLDRGHAIGLLRRACQAADQKRKITTVALALAGMGEVVAWLVVHMVRLVARGVAAVALGIAAGAAMVTGSRPPENAPLTGPAEWVARALATAAGGVTWLFRRLRGGRAARFTPSADCTRCDHPLATHTRDLGCWLCDCLYLRETAELEELPRYRVAGLLPPAATTVKESR